MFKNSKRQVLKFEKMSKKLEIYDTNGECVSLVKGKSFILKRKDGTHVTVFDFLSKSTLCLSIKHKSNDKHGDGKYIQRVHDFVENLTEDVLDSMNETETFMEFEVSDEIFHKLVLYFCSIGTICYTEIDEFSEIPLPGFRRNSEHV